jgi:hypothetical protein
MQVQDCSHRMGEFLLNNHDDALQTRLLANVFKQAFRENRKAAFPFYSTASTLHKNWY